MKLIRKLTALAMAVLLAFTPDCMLPQGVGTGHRCQAGQAMGLVEESEDDDTDTTARLPPAAAWNFPRGWTPARPAL